MIALLPVRVLLFVTGRKPEMRTCTACHHRPSAGGSERAGAWAVLGTAGGLNLALMGGAERHKRYVVLLRTVHPVFVAAAFALRANFALIKACARNQEPQLRQAVLVDSIHPRCWRTFVQGMQCIRHSFGKLRRMLFRDYKNAVTLLLLFTAYSVVLAFCARCIRRVGGSFLSSCLTVWFRGRLLFSSNASPALSVSWMPRCASCVRVISA